MASGMADEEGAGKANVMLNLFLPCGCAREGQERKKLKKLQAAAWSGKGFGEKTGKVMV